MIHADNITIDDDEGRYFLLVDTDEETGAFRIDIHDCVLEFYEAVRREIGPYAAEAESARSAVRAGVSLKTYMGAAEDDDDPLALGYAPDDPKSPGYHDRMAGGA